MLAWHLRQYNAYTWELSDSHNPLVRLAHHDNYLMVETFGKVQSQRRAESTQPWALFTNAFFTVDFFEKAHNFRSTVTDHLSPWETTMVEIGTLPVKSTDVAISDGNSVLWVAERALEVVEHAIVALKALPSALGTIFLDHVERVLGTHLRTVHLRLQQSELKLYMRWYKFIRHS